VVAAAGLRLRQMCAACLVLRTLEEKLDEEKSKRQQAEKKCEKMQAKYDQLTAEFQHFQEQVRTHPLHTLRPARLHIGCQVQARTQCPLPMASTSR
jgi:esterase/lipase